MDTLWGTLSMVRVGQAEWDGIKILEYVVVCPSLGMSVCVYMGN